MAKWFWFVDRLYMTEKDKQPDNQKNRARTAKDQWQGSLIRVNDQGSEDNKGAPLIDCLDYSSMP